MDIIKEFTGHWNDHIKNYKTNFLNPVSKSLHLLGSIRFLNGSKRIVESYLGYSQYIFYEMTLLINNEKVTFFKKVMNDEEETITRWRFENSDSLEMPIEHFFYHLGISKREAFLCEEVVENFPFLKTIHQLEREL